MARSEHIEILRHGVEIWNRWRRENPETIPDLRDASLRGAVLRGVHFQDALLQGADLEGADLQAADPFDEDPWGGPGRSGQAVSSFLWGGHILDQVWSSKLLGGSKKGSAGQAPSRDASWGADLWASHLQGAHLRGAHLRGANLRGTDFSGADLSGADLRETDLRDTTLWSALLSYAALQDADLRYARMGTTALAGIDLSRVQGLDTVEHLGPSILSFDTLEATAQGLTVHPASRSEIEVFFRRAGFGALQEELFREMVDGKGELPACYISYSHVDKAFARWLYERLQERGVRCWLHQHEAHQDDDSQQMVDAIVQPWEKVLLCCSKSAVSSWWIDGELERAAKRERWLAKERRRQDLALLGLNLDGYLFESRKKPVSGEAQLKERLVADFSGWEKRDANLELPFERLLRALEAKPAKGGKRS